MERETEDWTVAVIGPIIIKGKGSIDNCRNYRRISLLVNLVKYIGKAIR